MSDRREVALAVGAHPDDVEFFMAGTLALLARAGYEPHIFTVANGSCGSATLDAVETARVRRAESERAARVIGATYHPALVDDLMIFYEDRLLRRVTAVVRETRPTIVLLHSPDDYMEDHMIAARLTVTACFCRAMRNYVSEPPREPTRQDVYLYHAQPSHNRDGMRNLVVPETCVDVTDVIETKAKMLACHESQRSWFDETQGMDDYIATMRELCAEVARMANAERVRYAEGFRRHSHIGYSAEDRDILREVLGERVIPVRLSGD